MTSDSIAQAGGTFRHIATTFTGASRGARQSGEPVRRHSRRAGACEAGFWRKTTRQEVQKILMAARRYELAHKQPGRRNGPLGGVALELLSLFANLVSYRTGRLDPSLDWICDKLRRSRDAVVRGLKSLRDHGFLDWLRRFEPTRSDGPGPQVRQVSNAYRLSAPKRAMALLGRWAGRPALPDDDQAERIVRGQIEADHVADLDLSGLALFQLGESPLGQALARLGKSIDLRESAKRTESRSTSSSLCKA